MCRIPCGQLKPKHCSDCHVSAKNDNNAWLAQLLLQGTNFVNFMGRYVYVAADDALEVVVATERSEPQAVFGSTLQKIAYPDNYEKFVKGGSELKTFYEHVGNPRVLQVQLRGEYAYVAAGEGGLARLRCGPDRSEGFFGTNRYCAGVALWTEVLGEDEICDGGGCADDAGG